MAPTQQSPLNWALTKDQIEVTYKRLINEKKTLLDTVAALPLTEATFDSVVLPIARLDNETAAEFGVITFVQHVSADKELRDASTDAEKALVEFEIECGMREDVFKVVDGVYKATDKSKLSPEDARLLEKTHLDFRRNGLALPKDQLAELRTIKKRLSELSIQFSRNLNEADVELLYTREELEGMPDDFIAGLKTKDEDGVTKYVVTTQYPDLFPLLTLATREESRKRMAVAGESKCKENVAILEEAIELRQKAAKLLGYPNHAAFVLEVKMAKSPEKVLSFLQDLRNRLAPLGQSELDQFRKYKQEDLTRQNQDVSNVVVESWDYRYYMNKVKEREYNVDDEAIKQYFSMDIVTTGMLNIYQTVLGLKFVEKDASQWHEEARLFEVWDSASDTFMGHFYLDLYPRKGKYGHAACFPIRPGSQLSDGTYSTPVAAMVANFSKPTPNTPSLLKHDEVVTYFHELGHVMHHLCSQTRWARFHGTSTENDFVEAPSQMLENWCWEPKVLRDFSSHYQTKEPIPDALLDSLIKSKNACAGLFNLRQLFFGLFDLTVHTQADGKVDTTQLWRQMRQDISLIQPAPNTWPAASFGHIMGGYDAGYYGYLWSQVFSADMFYSRFRNEGVMNPQTGKDYRFKILHPGGSRDGGDLLRGFLSRDPTIDPFLKSLGLE
ncbi:metalloendopeptidase [Dimargaris xerosporica]|nr:metalloendopeptidase [Dimargaris xerosporica]